jgi:CheY-like chemotaxis protein
MPRAKGKRILLVDGDPQMRRAATLMLQELKATVVHAKDGVEALSLCESQPFDIVVTDYYLPEMKGDALAKAIKSVHPKRRVVLMTGYVKHVRGRRLAPLCVDAILPKPFGLKELAKVVRPRRTATRRSATH